MIILKMARKFKKFFSWRLILVILAVFLLFYSLFAPQEIKYYLNSTFIGKWLTPSRNALKKALNIIHVPYWLKSSELPAYYFKLSRSDRDKLINSIPFDTKSFSYSKLLEEDKQYVKVDFSSPSDNYQGEVRIRYRGLMPNNWDAEKKSIRVKFPAENLFSGMSALNLQIPDDRSYFGEMLDAYRAKKFGLLTPEFKFVRVFIDGRDYGVYLASEPWSKEFLARSGTYDTDNILSNKDVEAANGGESFFSEKHKNDWKSYTNKNNPIGPFEELNVLIALIENSGDKEFAQKIGAIFDLDKFYRWQLLYALAGSHRARDTENAVLLFKTETGEFELLPWDIGLYPADLDFYSYGMSTLAKRILGHEKFLADYKKIVNDYASNEANLQDDLAYYDGLDKKYHFEFYKDQAKLDTDYVFDQKIKDYRSFVVDNFKNLGQITAVLSVADFKSGELINYNFSEIEFNSTFEHFNDMFLSRDEFLARHPQFNKLDDYTIVLPSGSHIFEGITIVPKGLRLAIEPGAQLLFGPGASLVSYSAVSATAAADNPIIMKPLKPEEKTPWGVFGVINTGIAKNYFDFIHVNGGSSAVINGILFHSQFSLNNAVSEVRNSVFENSHSDDNFHVVLGSIDAVGNVFRNAQADGADIDYVKDSKISGNFFFNPLPADSNGDGLDISGTEKLEVSHNKIMGFGDKCISVGEKASANIANNILVNCNAGIAVKDDSQARISNNIIIANKTSGIALYRKKPEFLKGGSVEISDSVLWGNKEEIIRDDLSIVSIINSVVEGGYKEGKSITEQQPDWELLLPAYMLKFAETSLSPNQ